MSILDLTSPYTPGSLSMMRKLIDVIHTCRYRADDGPLAAAESIAASIIDAGILDHPKSDGDVLRAAKAIFDRETTTGDRSEAEAIASVELGSLANHLDNQESEARHRDQVIEAVAESLYYRMSPMVTKWESVLQYVRDSWIGHATALYDAGLLAGIDTGVVDAEIDHA